jgi:hypothetical protein
MARNILRRIKMQKKMKRMKKIGPENSPSKFKQLVILQIFSGSRSKKG